MWAALKYWLAMGAEPGLEVTLLNVRPPPEQLARNEPLMRVDVPNPHAHGARMPSGMEPGANELFRPGGYTSGGAPEAVIDPVPAAQTVITGPFF